MAAVVIFMPGELEQSPYSVVVLCGNAESLEHGIVTNTRHQG